MKKENSGFEGLFDFDTMKQEQLKIAKNKQEKVSQQDMQQNLLHVKPDETLDALFSNVSN